jgi:hydroxypyruvate isomerase
VAGVVQADARAAETVFVATCARRPTRRPFCGMTLLIEPINRRGKPGYFLHRVEH